LDLRHPFRDRRLAEFMLAIPAYELYNRSGLKCLARLAMERLLPANVVSMPDDANLYGLFRLGVRVREKGELGRLLRADDALWRQYIQQQEMDAFLDDAEGTSTSEIAQVALWNSASIEMWRTRCRGPSSKTTAPL